MSDSLPTEVAEGIQRISTEIQGLREKVDQILRYVQIMETSRATEELDDPLPEPARTNEELQEFCRKLDDSNFHRQMASFLARCGGHSLSNTARRILTRLATNAVWSLYSLKGRKGKMSFLSLPCARLVLRACQRNHKDGRIDDIENEIAEFLKHAPKRVGGVKYKQPPSRLTLAQSSDDEGSVIL